MDIDTLVKVTARAWSLNILALMHSGTPGRQAALLAASGAGRTALAQSLNHLIDLKLVQRNPGHGHPLRPEFRLTAKGVKAAAIAYRIINAVPHSCERSLLRRSWTVPILSVSHQPRYFTEIKGDLKSISDRALSQSLKKLQSQRWIQRKVDPDHYPPRPIYQATNAGAKISRAVATTNSEQ